MTAAIANQVSCWDVFDRDVCGKTVAQIPPPIFAAIRAAHSWATTVCEQQQAACGTWPRLFFQRIWPPRSGALLPTLIISSAIDPVTPPQLGEKRCMPRSPHSPHVVLLAAGTHRPTRASSR